MYDSILFYLTMTRFLSFTFDYHSFCVDDKQKETGPGKFYGLDGPFKDSKSFMIIKNSGKRGGCSCTCGVGAAAQSS